MAASAMPRAEAAMPRAEAEAEAECPGRSMAARGQAHLKLGRSHRTPLRLYRRRLEDSRLAQIRDQTGCPRSIPIFEIGRIRRGADRPGDSSSRSLRSCCRPGCTNRRKLTTAPLRGRYWTPRRCSPSRIVDCRSRAPATRNREDAVRRVGFSTHCSATLMRCIRQQYATRHDRTATSRLIFPVSHPNDHGGHLFFFMTTALQSD